MTEWIESHIPRWFSDNFDYPIVPAAIAAGVLAILLLGQL